MFRMARLVFPSGKVVHLSRSVPALQLGRADVARYPEAISVSRVQAIAAVGEDAGRPALKLTSCGSQNPTVVLAAVQGNHPRELSGGQSAFLRDGDAFSLICTRPDLAIRVHLESPPPTPHSDMTGTSPRVPAPAGAAGTAAAASASGAAAPADDVTRGDGGGAILSSDDPASAPSEAYTSDDDDASRRTGDEPPGPSSGGAGGGGGGPAAGRGGAGAASEPGGGRRGGRKSTARGVGNDKTPVKGLPPVVLLLAGLPGSGKSTFSRALLQASSIAWVHINQDAIRSGRPGSREQCIAAARTALQEGACCVIDRCHNDTDQRDTFLALAKERGVAAHCVALTLPPDLCARRVASRTDHPGGVQGDSSKGVVFRMAKQQLAGKSWPPTAAEGFESVMDCRSESDANAAVRAWAVYGAEGAVPAAAATGASAGLSSEAAAAVAATAAARVGPAAGSVTHGSAGTVPRSGDAAAAAAASAQAAAAATLAIWQAHASKRKPAAAGIAAFFKPAGGAAAAGAGASVGKAPAGVAGIGGAGLGTRAGGAAVGARPAPPGAKAAAAAAGVSKGSGASAARGAAGGAPAAAPAAAALDGGMAGGAGSRRRSAEPPAGEPSAKRQATGAAASQPGAGAGAGAAIGTGGGGGAAPASAAAATGTGVSAAQASPAAPAVAAAPLHPLPDSATGSQPSSSGKRESQGGSGSGGAGTGEGANAFALLMKGSRQVAAAAGGPSGGGGGSVASPSGAGGSPGEVMDKRFKLTGAWAQALRSTALDPDKSPQQVLHKDDKVVIILDAYPKARHHALVIARDPGLRSIADLRAEHGPLLEHMRHVGENWARERRAQDAKAAAFKLGFHAVPSMCQLHLHVVSQDFDSPALKNKKHWNSFTSAFFLPLDAVEYELSSRGRVTLVSEAEEKRLEGQDLRCHGCGKPQKTMPELKKHITSCEAVRVLPGL